MSNTAFFYGTLMAPEVLNRVVFGSKDHPNASRLTVNPAILFEYRRRRVLGCDYPAITPHQTSSVRGAYVTGLTDADVHRLDVFEGDQYSRDKVKVKVWDGVGIEDDIKDDTPGVEVIADTYVWKSGEDELEEQEWDFEHFRRDKMKRWMGDEAGDGADEGFAEVDAVARQGAAGHDPTGGRGANGHITNMLNAHNLRMG